MRRKLLLKLLQEANVYRVEMIYEAGQVHCYSEGYYRDELIQFFEEEIIPLVEARDQYPKNFWFSWFPATDAMTYDGQPITVEEMLKEGEVA